MNYISVWLKVLFSISSVLPFFDTGASAAALGEVFGSPDGMAGMRREAAREQFSVTAGLCAYAALLGVSKGIDEQI